MISDVEIAKYFVKATVDILSTMAGIKAESGKPYIKNNTNSIGDISAIVGVTGIKKGTIAVSFTKASAIELVRGMLGDDIQDLMQDLQDAVGEVANMVSGHARAGLAGAGLTLQGATPSVIIGDGHAIHHITKGPVMVIPFATPAGQFTVEFCFE